MSKKKKIFVLSGMVALLVITGVLNIVLNQRQVDPPPAGGGVVTGNHFDQVRADKLAARQETLLFLQAIIEAGGEGRAEAEAQKLAITASMAIETSLEGLIKALGHDEVVVTATSTFVNVVLRAEDLTDIQVAQIVRVIVGETDRTASNIRIIPIS